MNTKPKPWGTIFFDTGREATLDSLEAMQAPLQQERKAKEDEQAYLERVRIKATARAKEILEHAYIERQTVLDAAAEQARLLHEDAAALRAEAQSLCDAARHDRADADSQLLAAKAEREAAHGTGFEHGMSLAHEELARARTELGGALAWLLHAFTGASSQIFDAWRQELVALLKVCVEKGTALVLEERHAAMLERLFVDAARRMEQQTSLTVRVHPDAEAFVSDMLLAAQEHVPRLEQWLVVGDASIQGGLVVESPSGAVDSRQVLRNELVDNILRHLTLPESPADHMALAGVETVYQSAAAHAATIAPPPEGIPENTPQNIESVSEAEAVPIPEHRADSPDSIAKPDVEPAISAISTVEDVPPEVSAAIVPDISEERIEIPAPPKAEVPRAPTLAELEEELLPQIEDVPADTALVTGGFLDDLPHMGENARGGDRRP